MIKYIPIFISFSILFFSSCNTSKGKYEDLTKLESAAEIELSEAKELDKKIKICENIIKVFSKFLDENKDIEFENHARLSMDSWIEKREKYSAELKFQELKTLEVRTEDILSSSSDYSIKLEAAENLISKYEEFLKESKNSELNTVAELTLRSWKSKKEEYTSEFNELVERLNLLTKEETIKQCRKRHPLSNIESMQYSRTNYSKSGSYQDFEYIYDVRMKGALFGSNIFKPTVKLQGRIDMSNKNAFITYVNISE